MRTVDLTELLGGTMDEDTKNRYVVRTTVAIFEQGADIDGFRLVHELDAWTNGRRLEIDNPTAERSIAMKRLIANASQHVNAVALCLRELHDDAEAAFRQLSEQDSAPVPDAGA